MPLPKPVVEMRKEIKGKRTRGTIELQRHTNNMNTQHWVFFPLEKHKPRFQAANAEMRKGGPGKANPTAVGTIQVGQNVSKPKWEIKFAQAHFKTGPKPLINRALATKYAGWRRHTFEGILEKAKVRGIVVRLRYDPLKENQQLLKEFRETAEKLGFCVKVIDTAGEEYDGKKFLEASPPNPA